MNHTERQRLVTGIVIGLLLAGAIYGAAQYVNSRRIRTNESAKTGSPAGLASELPAPESTSDQPVSIALTPDEQTSIGVETTEVKRQAVRKEVTAPARVAEPETGLGTISARVSGRIEKLFLDATGETVSRGQVVASIYSPDVFATVEEHRLAIENRQRLSDSKESRALAQADELVQASRRRLELWGLTTEQIDDLQSTTSPAVQITIQSSVAGVVTKRNVTEGQYVKERDVLYTVTDLSTVWVQADVFEFDIAAVRVGMDARIMSPAIGARPLTGTVNFLQPSIDPQTRTIAARIQVANPGMRLRPGMYVQVSFSAPLSPNTLAVPQEAVLNTGKEQIVYVAKDNGLFERRVIEAEAVGDEYYSVLKGLQAGERVVTKGNFLIDSQSRLSGSISGMFGGSKAFGAEGGSPQTPSQNYTVTLQPEPSPRKAGSDGIFRVTVTAPDGKPVSDAQAKVTLVMPAMPSMGMGEMRSSINLVWNGSEYAGKGPIAMNGGWNVTVEANRNGQLLGVYRSRFDAK